MKLKALKLNNIMGFGAEEGTADFEFNQLNFVKGSNGQGKTRLLKLIRFIFQNRMETAWIRTEDKGESEIICHFDNGERINIKIDEEGKATREFFDEHGLPEIKEKFMSMLSSVMLDTEKFFSEKEWTYRVQCVLSVIKAKITKEDWINKIGNEFLPLIKFDDFPLMQLQSAEKYYFEKRKAANQVKTEFEKTVNQLKNALPSKELLEIPFDEKLKECQKNIEKKIQEKNDKIYNQSNEVNKQIVEKEKLIEQLKAKLEVEQEKLDELYIELDEIADRNEKEFEPELMKLRQIKTDLERDKKIADSAHFKFEQFNETEQKLVEYIRIWSKYDSLVEITRTWYKEIASQIEIPGIEIGEKDLLVDTRPWAVTNQGRQVDIFLQIASLLNPDFPLILIDRFESIGEEIRERLLPKLKEKDFQVILAEHTKQKNIPLTIEK